MPNSATDSLKIKAKLLQKAKLKAGKKIQLKEAFAILAKAAGFNSWNEMKELYSATDHYCPKGSSARWKIWCRNYDEALEQLATVKGFLIPYRDQFFICDNDYLEFLGIDPADSDLHAVGNKFVEPANSQAFARITARILNREKI